jgi:hypothetical protein
VFGKLVVDVVVVLKYLMLFVDRFDCFALKVLRGLDLIVCRVDKERIDRGRNLQGLYSAENCVEVVNNRPL